MAEKLMDYPTFSHAQLGPYETRTAMPTPKNNSKHNNCTLECIELGTCKELSLKLQREKVFFRVLLTART